MEIKVFKNCFSEKYEILKYNPEVSLIEQIEKHIDVDTFKSTMVECYDSETGETFYAPISEESEGSLIILANGKSVTKDYKPSESDEIVAIYTPLGDSKGWYGTWGAGIGALFGMLLYSVAVIASGGAVSWVGLLLFGGMGAALGITTGLSIYDMQHSSSTSSGKDLENPPDVRGSNNQSILNANFPFVIGKHLATPYVLGKPYTEYSGNLGKDAYIRSLFLVGYSPLKLTDLKLDEFYLAYNRTHNNIEKDTFISGYLKGYSEEGEAADSGDILDYWKHNDIEVEILQQHPDAKSCKINPEFQVNTLCDLSTRPLVPGTVMQEAGWTEVADDDICTLYSSSYTLPASDSNNERGVDITVLATPIRPDGTVMKATGQTFSGICMSIAREIGKNPDLEVNPYTGIYYTNYNQQILAVFFGEDSIEQADEYAEALHLNQEEYYFGGNSVINRGVIYPEFKDEQEVNANVLFIADEALDETTQVAYKGKTFPNNFKTNGVFFTSSCPREFTVNIDFSNSLYETHTETSNNSTKTKYNPLHLWVCAQWRFYDVNNESSAADGSDFNDWNNIYFGSDYQSYFTSDSQNTDKAAHKGNKLSATNEKIYGNFRNKLLNDFYAASQLAVTDATDTIPEIRLSATITLTKEQCKELLKSTNPTKSIEIRVLRVSPSFINETSSDSDSKGAESYADIMKVTTIVTKTFDEEKLKNEDVLIPVRPLSDADMKKFTLVAIKAKADELGYISSQLQKFNCMAESFSPVWDKENHKMLPEGVTDKVTYYGYFDSQDNRVNRSNDAIEREVTKEEYEAARHDGIDWLECQQGSTFGDIIKEIVFDTETEHNDRLAYTLSAEAAKYNNNSVASGFMLGCVGSQNGPVSVGYDSINLLSVGEWAEKTEALTDGSTFNSDTTYNGVEYQKGDLVPVRYEANAYVTNASKMEDLLQKLAFAGRAVWSLDNSGRVKIIMDAPVDYPKGVISGQNCANSSNTFSWEQLPAGLLISFSDENDGYETNQFFCWSDGNSLENYHGKVENYSIDFVTSPYQMWSLGRYLLAVRLQQKEVLSRTIGREGHTYELGDVVMVQSDELLIGETSGRVKELIEENGIIYGFVTDATYEYTGELGDDGNSVQGVIVHQPGYMGKSNVITLPLSKPMSKTIQEQIVTDDGHVETIERTYTLKKGITNVVLFGEINGEYGVSRSSEDSSTSTSIKYNIKIDDTVLFGLIDKIAAPYRIIKIKPEAKGAFTETLAPYDEGIYNAGAELPTFQNYLTPPPVLEPPVSLSDVPTTIAEINSTQSSLHSQIDSVNERIDEIVIEAGDTTPPTVPSITSVTSTETGNFSIVFTGSTDTESGVSHYNVFRQEVNSGYELVARVDHNDNVQSYTISDVIINKNKVYSYKISAVDNASNESATCTAVSQTSSVTALPTAPTNLVAKTVDENRIEITWVKSNETDTVYATKYFNLYISRDDGVNWTKIYSPYTEKYYYYFDRTADGYPETTDLADYKFKIEAVSEYGNASTALQTDLIYTGYKGWQPSKPTLTTRTSGRTITLVPNEQDLYGEIIYKVLVNNLEKDGSNWYKPTPTADYLSSENNYRDTTQQDVPYETTAPYTQTMPLKGQNDVAWKLYSWAGSGDYDDSSSTTKKLTYSASDPSTSQTSVQKTMYINGEEKIVDYWYDDENELNYASFQITSPNPVDTPYRWKIKAYNTTANKESSYSSLITAYARATGITDVVNSAITQNALADDAVTADKIATGTITAEKIFVQTLSAITANMGKIKAGSLEGDENNFWHLSADESHSAGEFKIGGTNQYVKVYPNPDKEGDYIVEINAGNIALSSGDDAQFSDGTYIYDPSDTSRRLLLSKNGITVQRYNSSIELWDDLGKIKIDTNGNLSLTNKSVSDYTLGFVVTGSIYHFDTTPTLDENGSNSKNISCTGEMINTKNLTPILFYEDSPYCFKGEISKDITDFVNTIVFLSKSSYLSLGDTALQSNGVVLNECRTLNNELKTDNVYLGLTTTQKNKGIFFY